MRVIYGIYDKNETLVCTGDKFECADYLGIKASCFHSTVSKQKKRKKCKYRIKRLFEE